MDFVSALGTIGEYLPLLIPLIAYFGLHNKHLALLLALDSLIINPVLKKSIGLLGLQSKRPHCQNLNTYGCFGMPSGHTEIHWILLTYLIYEYFFDSNKYSKAKLFPILTLVIIMTVVVMWQRLYTGMHSVIQVFAGALVGILIGFFFVRTTRINRFMT